MSELLPCPFCGGSDWLRTSTENMQPDDLWWGYVQCDGCDAQGPGEGWADSKEEAEEIGAAKWNERAAPKPGGRMSYGWLQAVDEAMVTAHLYVADKSDSYETAKRKLGELIDWHVAVATDPRVNGGYQAVPVMPDDNMMRAAWNLHLWDDDASRQVYAAMLAAAPKPGGE